MRPLPHGRAIGWMCLGVAGLAASDAFAKVLIERFDAFQILFLRNCLSLPVILGLILTLDGHAGLRTRTPRVHLARACVTLAALWTFYTSLAFLPLGSAVALGMTSTLFVTALSGPLLGERVGPLRWAGVVAGFAGALVIIRPGAETVQPAALLTLAAAFFYALVMIGARWIDPGERPRTMMLYLALFPSALCVLAMGAGGGFPSITPADAPIFAGMALVGTAGITLLTQAFRMAPASVVAPFDYTMILWGTGLGWLIWGEVPDAWLWLGAAIIAAAGLFVMWREGRAA